MAKHKIIELKVIKNFMGYKEGDIIFPDLLANEFPLFTGESDVKKMWKYTKINSLMRLINNGYLEPSKPLHEYDK